MRYVLPLFLLIYSVYSGQSAEVRDTLALKDANPAMFSIYIDNDMYAGSDQEYTSGVKGEWMSSARSTKTGFSARLASLMGGGATSSGWASLWGMNNSDPNTGHRWGLTLTQLIFTPISHDEMPHYDERGYAGYLALGLTSHVQSVNRATSLELQLGVTGKPSIAEECQHGIHNFWDAPQWYGWNHQLPTEVTFNLFLKRYYNLTFLSTGSSNEWGTDGLCFWHADAGTVYVRAGIGGTFRFGYNLAASSSANLNVVGASFAPSPFTKETSVISPWSFYGYISTTGRLVAHDMFIDGTVFHDSQKYSSKEPWVYELTAGIGMVYKRFEFLFGYVWRSQEYKAQDDMQGFGSLQLRYKF